MSKQIVEDIAEQANAHPNNMEQETAQQVYQACAVCGVLLGTVIYSVTEMHRVTKYIQLMTYFVMTTSRDSRTTKQTRPKKSSNMIKHAEVAAFMTAASVWLFLKYCHAANESNDGYPQQLCAQPIHLSLN